MIGLTRTTGERCFLDPAHIQRVEADPATVVHLSDGAKYVVTEDLDEIVRRIRVFRAGVRTDAWQVVNGVAAHPTERVGSRARQPYPPGTPRPPLQVRSR